MRSFLYHPACVAVVLGSLVSTAQTGTIKQPSGFYVMQAVHQANVANSVLATPRLAGIHLRDTWSLLEPTPTIDSFTWLDDQVARAKSLNKKVTLGIYAGTKSPSWLNAPLISGAPLPWDATVVTAYSAMVAELGAHFRNEAAIDAVHISSPATNNSMEMYLPDGTTTTAGYSDQKIIDVWKSAINSYASAFPNKALVLDVAMVPDAKGAATDAVTAYALQTLGDRINFIHCSLKASTNPFAPHHQTLVDLHEAGGRIGFEMACPSTDTTRFGGTFADALAIGQGAGASWYQIYQADVPLIPANFFNLPGDYNQDGLVDAGDYLIWRRALTTQNLAADGDGNGIVDQNDYKVWRAGFNSTSASGAMATAVLEPALGVLILIAMSLGLLKIRCRNYEAWPSATFPYNTLAPRYFALAPNDRSIRKSSFHLAVRSPRVKDPTLI